MTFWSRCVVSVWFCWTLLLFSRVRHVQFASHSGSGHGDTAQHDISGHHVREQHQPHQRAARMMLRWTLQMLCVMLLARMMFRGMPMTLLVRVEAQRPGHIVADVDDVDG